MVFFSLAFEGDKNVEEYIKLSSLADELGFYSFQIYEHIPFKPALPISFIISRYTNRIKIGAVTIPVFLYRPIQLARYLSLLHEIANGREILAISRGAYYELINEPVKRSINDVVNFLKELDDSMKRIFKLEAKAIEIYVGTSGPLLAKRATSLEMISGIVVDMLWNPVYARKMKEILMSSNKNRKIQLIARPFTFIDENSDRAKSKMTKIVSSYIKKLVGNSPMLASANVKYEDLSDMKVIEEKVIPNFTATGTIEEVLEQTAKMIEAGVDHICYGHPLSPEPLKTIKLIKDKIINYFSSY
jgi:5,10-methylenetetrahydromethanopterin reductase